MISKTLWIHTESTCCENSQVFSPFRSSCSVISPLPRVECGWLFASLTTVCPAMSLFSSAVSQQMARGGRRPRGEKGRPWQPSHAPAVGSLHLRQESEGVSRCVLNGCPGLKGAGCGSAEAWGGLQQGEPRVCRGDMRTSGPCPCEQGSHCRPLKILPHRPPAP